MPTAIPSGITSVGTESQRGVTSFADMRTGLFGSGDPSQNYLINGAADFTQRYAVDTPTADITNTAAYFADRFYAWGGASTTVVGLTTSSSLLPDLGFSTQLRLLRKSGNTGTAECVIGQIIESANVRALIGKQVTISFLARSGANFSAAGATLTTRLVVGTGTDQGLASRIAGTWTGIDTSRTSSTAITSSWVRYSATFTVPVSARELAVEFYFVGVGTAGAADNFDITGMMLNIGPVALPFQRAGGTIGGELALCQRYYFRVSSNGTGFRFGAGMIETTSSGNIIVSFPTQMRLPPTLETTGTAADYSLVTSVATSCTAVPTLSGAGSGQLSHQSLIFTTAATLTVGQGSHARAANSSAYLGFNSEL